MKSFLFILFLAVTPAFCAETGADAGSTSSFSAIFSLFRVMGALAIVFSIFFGAIYLFKNWQKMLIRKAGKVPKLNILEVKSLGPRQAIYVIGYEQQRLLIASSPSGISMLTTLAEEPWVAPEPEPSVPEVKSSFAETLTRTWANTSFRSNRRRDVLKPEICAS